MDTQKIANTIHKSLLKSGKTVSTAESCTGGYLSSLLTLLSGSSIYFILGVVSYSNASKERILKIPSQTLRKYGAVSKEVALLMAKNVSRLANTDFGIGITGIAGPTGATQRKPVGLVYIGLATKSKSICKKFLFKGNRDSIRKQAALRAISLLKTAL